MLIRHSYMCVYDNVLWRHREHAATGETRSSGALEVQYHQCLFIRDIKSLSSPSMNALRKTATIPPSEPPHGLPSCPFLAKVSEESINHLDIIIQHVQVTEVLRHEVASKWPALLEEVLVVHTFQSTWGMRDGDQKQKITLDLPKARPNHPHKKQERL